MILSIDQGTTGTTCFVYDEQAKPLARTYRELRQHFPRPGWVEHDATEIWELARTLALEALASAGAQPGGLAAVGITNQRETVCVWDPSSGEPLHHAIVWQDRRTAELCERLRAAGHEPLVRERTGLVLDPYFSATKIRWLLDNVPGLADRARAGEAVFGTIDSWLLFKLTGSHLTDPSNAARTLLYDIVRGRWDPELLELFEIPAGALPEVRPSAGVFAQTLPGVLGAHRAPVAGVVGDQQAALFGQACLQPGLGKNTYGTGSFVLLNTGTAPPPPAPGLLSTVAWSQGGRTDYALEASIFATGAAVQWLRDGLAIISDASETETLAASLRSNEGVYFVPALTGLGSPHWDPHARGTIVGLTRGSGRAHLARATLEAIAYQTVDAVRAMESASGAPLDELRVDGGASANAWLMQFQADVLGVPVVVAETPETTALGAGMLAGVGVGRWTLDDVAAGRRARARYEPRMSEQERSELLAGWADALARTRAPFATEPPPGRAGE
jgi:glycerol kinase